MKKTIIVTGAGKGIGLAIAEAFLDAGDRVAIITRSRTDVARWLRGADPKRAWGESGDVANETTVRRFVADVRRRFRAVDVLVNNAAVLAPTGPVPTIRTADWDRSMAVNLRGPFLLMKHVIPLMTRRGSGLILNVNSGVAKRAAPGWGPYAVSKAGLDNLTTLAAAELNGTGVRVNGVNPGGTRTRMRAAAYPGEDPGALPTPQAVSRLFVWLASDKAKDLNGAWIDYREWARKKHRSSAGRA